MEASCYSKVKVIMEVDLNYMGTILSPEEYIRQIFKIEKPNFIPNSMCEYNIKNIQIKEIK